GVIADANSVSIVASRQLNQAGSQLDFYRSVDGGASWWTAFAIGQGRAPMAMIDDPSTGRIYVGGETLLVSADAGGTWSTIATPTSGFHTAAITNGKLLLGGESGFQSVVLDSGVASRFTPQLAAGQFLAVTLDSSHRVWAAGPPGLF